MESKSYKLAILPLFEEDLNEIVDYISHSLHNPSAAHSLVNDVEAAIMKRLKNPGGYEPFHSLKKRPHKYFVIKVKNFNIFYVLIENTMEVRRILYSKRDLENLPLVLVDKESQIVG